MISLLVTIAIVGAIVYLISLIPMPDIFRKVIFTIAAIGLLLFCLQSFGLWKGFGNLRIR